MGFETWHYGAPNDQTKVEYLMADEAEKPTRSDDLLRMTVEVVAAYVGNNSLGVAQVPDVISTVHAALSALDGTVSTKITEPLKPAVAVRRSVTADYIVCLEDGKKLKMLKRHLRAAYNMTPDEYRAKWNLPAEYPMVAPNYAAQRSDFAKRIGLGRKPGQRLGRRTKRSGS